MNKNVLNKLSKIESKVELAEVKVDLALIDDFKNLKSKAILEKDECLDIYLELKNKSNQLQTKIKEYVNTTSDLSDIQMILSNKYKELGLNFESSNEYKGYALAFDKQKEILDISSSISKLK